jgi:hypothetical protein
MLFCSYLAKYLSERKNISNNYCREERNAFYMQYAYRVQGNYSRGKLCYISELVQDDSKLLSGFPFIGHGSPDSNLESLCIFSN